MASYHNQNSIIAFNRQIFNSVIWYTVAMILVERVFLPFFQSQHTQVIIIVIRVEDEEIYDDYNELEEGEALSVQSDWED